MAAPDHLEPALALAGLGFPVFPCAIGGKPPMIVGAAGCLDATVDRDVIRRWWGRWPAANLGVASGTAFWVLDVDGDEGLAALADLEDLHRWLPEGPVSVTGSGGQHLLFAPNPRVKNSVKRLGPGLDTRGMGGYIVAPPSIHPNGCRYAWLPGRDPWSVPLPPAPGWLLDLLDPPRPERPPAPKVQPSTAPYVASALARELEAVAAAAPGARNATLNAASFALGRFVAQGDLGAVDVGEALVGAALAAGLTRIEATNTVASGLRAALRRSA